MKKGIALLAVTLLMVTSSFAGVFKKGTVEYRQSQCSKVRLLVAPLGNEVAVLICFKRGTDITYNIKDCIKMIKYSNPFVTGGPIVYVCGKSTFNLDRDEQIRREMMCGTRVMCIQGSAFAEKKDGKWSCACPAVDPTKPQ